MGAGSKVTQRLRGKIKGGEVGSRGIATYLTSPCQRARSVVAVGASMENAAYHTHKVEIREEPSKIAALVGRIFEEDLVRSEATNLVRLYREHPRPHMKVDDPISVVECDLDIKTDDSGNVISVNGERKALEHLKNKNENLSSNEALFRHSRNQILSSVAEADSSGSSDISFLFLQPTFQLEINGFTHHIRPDFVWMHQNIWRIGEIKVYLDRDGETSGIQVASTVKQAAVGILAIEQTFATPEYSVIKEETTEVAREVDVVFRRHGSYRATATRLNAEAEIESLKRGIHQAEEIINELSSRVTSIDSPTVIENIPNHYTLDCATNCPYDEICRKQKTVESGRVIHHHPGVLAGEHAGVSGERALELAQGNPPTNNQESVVARWLHAGWEQKT